ncbi:hypothetical protein [uncultured Sphingomonas sp.]|uniref:hypothetical protein n=1 Tax=uncultured Sphingomonas sp. TaxID=158754 RepID=UPI0025FCA389|nr:hypothetical protein [uncultured Sphingomonas sp.]
MLSRLTALPSPPNANDLTALLAGLDSCLALADKLDLTRVAIQIDQARCQLLELGGEGAALPGTAPKSFAPGRSEPRTTPTS